MNLLSPDLWQPLRARVQKPGHSILAILTLAVGMGACSAIYSLAHAILIRPLPFKNPDRLVIIESTKGDESGGISLRELRDIEEHTTSFEAIASYRIGAAYNFSGQGEPEELTATLCSHDFFEVLGIEMALGSTWPEKLDQERGYGIVLSHELWQRKFGGTPDAMDRLVQLDASPTYQIHGVLPPQFAFPMGVDLYRSTIISPRQLTDRQLRGNTGVARLRAGISLEAAASELALLSGKIASDFPQTNVGVQFRMEPLSDWFWGDVRPYLVSLSAAALLLLLIACLNVANMLLVRATNRDREVAIRKVMGASRARLLAQFLLESIVISLAGGLLGLLASSVMIDFLRERIARDLPVWLEIGIEGPVFYFALVVSILTGILAGLAPALRASGGSLSKLMRESRMATGGRQRHRLRNAFVALQLGLGIGLLATAGLLIQSHQRLREINVGFNPHDLLTFRVALPWKTYSGEPEKIRSFYRQSLERLGKIPGIEGVATTSNLPLSAGQQESLRRQSEFTIEGQSIMHQKANPYAQYIYASNGFFDLMEIPLIQGRTFSQEDNDHRPLVAIVNRQLADQYWPQENPIGKRIKLGNHESDFDYRSIVGVVGDVKMRDIRDETGFEIYIPTHQTPFENAYFVLRTSSGPPERWTEAVTAAIWAVDAAQSTYEMQSMDAYVDAKLWQYRTIGNLFSAFAFFAVLLAMTGTFGMITYMVGGRAREFGIRKVMGAGSGTILWLVLRKTGTLIGAGIALGTVFTYLLATQIEMYFFEAHRSGWIIFFLAALAIALVAVAAAFVPGWRASRIDPIVVLRDE